MAWGARPRLCDEEETHLLRRDHRFILGFMFISPPWGACALLIFNIAAIYESRTAMGLVLDPERSANDHSQGADLDKPWCAQDTHFLQDDDCVLFASVELCNRHRRETTWLASVPGSGNTWMRALLEHATGIYTGSMYEDESLLEADFVGESTTDPSRVLVVKTHAFDLTKLPERGSRAIILVRSPLDEAVSRIQMRQASLKGKNMHTAEIQHDDLQAAFDHHRDESLNNWANHLSFWHRFPGEKLFVKYEDLVDDPVKVSSLVLRFLGINISAVSSRLGCATKFQTPNITRNHTYTFEFTVADYHAAETIVGDLARGLNYTLR